MAVINEVTEVLHKIEARLTLFTHGSAPLADIANAGYAMTGSSRAAAKR
jgi:hypothetical protein